MNIMKFGGTSMGSPQSIIGCAELVEREIKLSGHKPLVVVSAHSGKTGTAKITDRLLEAAKKAVKGDTDTTFKIISDRHHEILDGLKLPHSVADRLLGELHDLLRGIHMVKEVTPRLYRLTSPASANDSPRAASLRC